jgi:hypothetical protein
MAILRSFRNLFNWRSLKSFFLLLATLEETMRHPLFFAFAHALVLTATAREYKSCDSPIYCEGPLLRTVQLSNIFTDSKTFVDRVNILSSFQGDFITLHDQTMLANRLL